MNFKQQLNAISNLRLPMILLIVACHVVPEVSFDTFDWWIVKIIGHEMASIGVPMFFLISGLLFFCNINSEQRVSAFAKAIYLGGGKIRKRIKSILIPYLLWNLIAYLVRSVVYRKVPFSLEMLFSHRLYFDWNWEQDCFFMYPCDGPLWFMRNLFLISLAAPIVFAFVKFIRAYIGIPILVLLYLFNIGGCYDMGMVSTFCFFTIGAYIGINRWCLLPLIVRNSCCFLIAYMLCAISDLIMQDIIYWHVYIFRLAILLGLPTLTFVAYRLPSNYKNIEFPSLSMFIYCAHGFLLEPVMSLGRHSGVESLTIVFLGNIILTVLLCIFGYMLVRNLKPVWIGKMLMGGR